MIYREWSPELIAALEAPFPAIDHKTKRQGGQEITFVDVHKYKERLNALVGPQGWSCYVRLEAFGGKLVATTAVTILGVTKENVGDEVEVPEVNERGNEKIIGASCTNSYAQAFKRTCSDFGLGAYLYNEGKRNAATAGIATGQRAPTGGQVSSPAGAPAFATLGPPDPPCPKCGGKMWDNRAKKTNPKAPDFKCRNKDSCDGVIWPPKEGAKPAPAPQPETSYEDAEDVALTAAKAAFDLEDDLDSLPF